MARALLLLYYFPPSGGPGVQRGLKLAARLPSLGIEPVVVTVDAAAYALPGEYAPDPSLAHEVPADVRVVRTASGDRRRTKAALVALRAYRLAWTALPGAWFERQAGWFAPALAACEAEIERARPDVILTSSQPYTVHLVGRELKARTGIPWVADFRDPWTFAWGRSWPSERAYAWEAAREDEVLSEADCVVANTPGSRAEFLARRPWLAPDKFVVVPNGYDEEDFAVPPAPRADGEVLVVHSGAFRATPQPRELRGLRAFVRAASHAPVPYDLAAHSPVALFQAMALAARRGTARPVRARLVGTLDPAWMRLAESLGVADRVEAVGYLPHREAVSHLLAADLLYLPTVLRADGGSVSNVPAKTYEYLGSGRPVAALAGPGDVRDLCGGRDRVRLLGPRDAEGLAGLLAELAEGGGPRAEAPDPGDVRPWRRSELAARMADHLARASRGSVMEGTPRGR